MTKVKFGRDDKNAKINTCAVLRHVLSAILKMLHPFMPFVTEEIYQMLPVKDSESIMISDYPKYNKKYIKIIYNKENIAEIDGNEFLEELKNRLNGKIGKVAFDCIFYDSKVHLIADKLIILKVGCSTLVQNNEEIFKQKVQEVIDELTS